jgi:hypothetical protein
MQIRETWLLLKKMKISKQQKQNGKSNPGFNNLIIKEECIFKIKNETVLI